VVQYGWHKPRDHCSMKRDSWLKREVGKMGDAAPKSPLVSKVCVGGCWMAGNAYTNQFIDLVAVSLWSQNTD